MIERQPFELRTNGDVDDNTCPVCFQAKLKKKEKQPVCQKCLKKRKLSLDLLYALKTLRLTIDQEEINWQQQPQPQITGQIDGKPWRAFFFYNGWQTQLVAPTSVTPEEREIVVKYLNRITPSLGERAHAGKSKIGRCIFLTALGTSILTALILLKLAQKEDNPPD